MDPEKDRLPIILAAIFFAGYFLYLWLRINPALHYLSQEPVFLLDGNFLSPFFTYPGGCTDLVSAFLGQLLYIPWVGALAMTLISAAIALFTALMGSFFWGPSKRFAIHLLPSVALLMLFSNYAFALTNAVSLLSALILSYVYLRLPMMKRTGSGAMFLVLGVALYYTSGSPFMLFAIITGLFELVRRKRYSLVALFWIAAAVIPWASVRFVLLDSIRHAYTNGSAFSQLPAIPLWMAITLYGLYPFMIGIPLLARGNRAGENGGRPWRPMSFFSRLRVPGACIPLCKVALFCIITGCAAWASFKPMEKSSLQMFRYLRQERWLDAIIQFCQSPVPGKESAYCQARAMYHLGRLTTSLFDFPQLYGAEGLFLLSDQNAMTHLFKSDLFFELGDVSEAQHWAYEALAMRGQSPWALRRLICTHALKGEYEAARTCAAILMKNPFFKNWVVSLLPSLQNDSALSGNAYLASIRASMPDSDYCLVVNDATKLDYGLNQLLMSSHNNRMAFEYLVAVYLLSGQVGEIAALLPYFDKLRYPGIPRTIEEALMVYSMSHNDKNIIARFTPKTIDDFEAFNAIIKKHGGTSAAEQECFKRYGNTFWYYYQYVLPGVEKQP